MAVLADRWPAHRIADPLQHLERSLKLKTYRLWACLPVHTKPNTLSRTEFFPAASVDADALRKGQARSGPPRAKRARACLSPSSGTIGVSAAIRRDLPARCTLLRNLILSGVLLLGTPCIAQLSPLAYACHYTSQPIVIDGKLNDAAWQQAPWTSDFVDIEGSAKPLPRFRTRAKMLWDDKYLYIAAELEEPNVHAALTQHDSVIFHDDDFEVFVKPLPESASYYEFEMNALNTGWDLFLNKPYKLGGKADNSWDIDGLRTAVAVHGTLNQPGDTDCGWTLEIAYPLSAFQSRQDVPHPTDGTTWRINFSRVEWKPGQAKEDNWVWSPQGLVDMHVPEHWGYLQFRKDR